MALLSGLFGRASKGDSPKNGDASEPNLSHSHGASSAMCLDRHGAVHSAPDDLENHTKLASRLGLEMRFAYIDALGNLTSRTVVIDGVFGDTLDTPLYLIGLCRLRKERRIFNVLNIKSVYLPSGALVTDNIQYFVSAMIRKHLGLEYAKAPLVFKEPVQLVVDVVERDVSTSVSGVLVGYTYEARSYGPRSYLTFKPDEPFNGSRRWIKMDLIPEITGYDMKSAGSISCGLTGEIIEDFYPWVANLLGLDRDGWPTLPTTSEA